MNTYHIPPFEKEVIEHTIRAACEYFDIPRDSLINDTTVAVANMRYLCFFLIFKNTALKDYMIADVFGKHRKTVNYGVSTIEFQKNIYAQTARNLRGIQQLMNNFEKKYEWNLQ